MPGKVGFGEQDQHNRLNQFAACGGRRNLEGNLPRTASLRSQKLRITASQCSNGARLSDQSTVRRFGAVPNCKHQDTLMGRRAISWWGKEMEQKS